MDILFVPKLRNNLKNKEIISFFFLYQLTVLNSYVMCLSKLAMCDTSHIFRIKNTVEIFIARLIF